MIDKFIHHLRSMDRAPGTISAYVSDLGIFCTWYQKRNHTAMTPTSVMSVDVREFKEALLTQGRSAATINRKLASLSSFFGWCVSQGIVDENPTGTIRTVRKQKSAPRWLARKEQRALVRALHVACQVAETDSAKFRAYRDRAMVALGMWCGLRRSEIANAEMSKLTLNGRSGTIEVLGKGQKMRTVPLNIDAYKAVKSYVGIRGERTSRYLFLSQQDAGMTAKSVYRAIVKYAKAAGVEMTPHSLRHTFGKSLADKGVSLEKIARLMGHESLTTTAIYLEPSGADLADAVDEIAWTD